MKFGKRFISLVLALVMVFGLTTGASSASAQNIKVQLSPNITVTYNGKVQNMKDAAGNAVYPLLNGGTTYLPVRAVANMLGVAVEWDGATSTVLLADPPGGRKPAGSTGDAGKKPAPSTITVQLSPSVSVNYNGKAQTMADVNGNPVYPLMYSGTTYLPIRAVSNMLGIDVDWDGATQTVVLAEAESETPDSLNENEQRFTPKVLGENHIGFDYAELDWSTANDGYVLAKLNKQMSKFTGCYITCNGQNMRFILPLGKWVKIPLFADSNEYRVAIYPTYTDADMELPIEKYDLIYREQLHATFTAEITDPNAAWLLSSIKVDYENAPRTCNKAIELTKNCKTDAEKVAAIQTWVATNIKYDSKLSNEIKVQNEKAAAGMFNASEELFKNGDRENLAPDAILASKSGVCEDYAVLMAAMLRSIGIPCKVVSGDLYNNDEWNNHAWVAISPDVEGLNANTLHGWTDPNGWLNLDPTNVAKYPSRTANASNYRAESAY